MNKLLLALRHLFSVSMILILVYTGIGIAAMAAPAHQYNGETVFRGLMMGDGPVAKLFPEYYPEPEAAELRDAAAKGRQNIVDAFRSEDTAFFDHWASDIQSGDRARIGKALGEVHKKLKGLMEKSPGTVHGYGQHQTGLMFSMHSLSEMEQDQLIDRIAKRLGPAGNGSKK